MGRMKPGTRWSIWKLLLIPVAIQILFFLQTCERFEPDGFFNVNTSPVTNVMALSATTGGEVTDDGGDSVYRRGVCWDDSSGPPRYYYGSDETENGSDTGTFVSYMTNLEPSTTYYVRAYAENDLGTTYGKEVSFTTRAEFDTTVAGVTDIDGNQYKAVLIGGQIWMAENLNVTRYADGTPIQHVEGEAVWDNLDPYVQAYCWYDNNSVNGSIFGALYTWAAAMNGAKSNDKNPSGVQGVCPDGWHLPSDEEWKMLELYLGMSKYDLDDTLGRGMDEGDMLKEAGTIHWVEPNEGANNVSGFTALPGGYRSNNGSFYVVDTAAYFWAATEFNDSSAWRRALHSSSARVGRYHRDKGRGLSVRCVMGAGTTVTLPMVSTGTATSVDNSGAILNGGITDNGGGTIREKGFYYGTSADPQSSGTIISLGSGTGTFSSTLTGLSANTTYYFVAFATNSEGTAYGEVRSFETSSKSASTLTDIDFDILGSL